MPALANKIALVTGAARGIGHAIAAAFAREGAAVALADIDGPAAAQAATTLRDQGADTMPLTLDVTAPASIEAALSALLARHGRIDLLVNNAGIGGNTPFLDTTLPEWDRIIATNLTGPFLVAQACARHMAGSGGGRIVNIASISGQWGSDGRAAYGSAKAGLLLLTKVMAVELAPHLITVNAIAPGAVETEMARQLHTEATRAAYARLIPLTRYGTPGEIAAAAVFLCSDAASYITGHTLNVDGGFGAAGVMSKP